MLIAGLVIVLFKVPGPIADAEILVEFTHTQHVGNFVNGDDDKRPAACCTGILRKFTAPFCCKRKTKSLLRRPNL